MIGIFTGRIDPLLLNFIVLGIVVLSVVMGIFTTLGHDADVQNLLAENRKQAAERFVIQQAEDIQEQEQIATLKQIVENSDKEGEARAQQLATLKQIVENQGNLSKEVRDQIVADIIKNSNETIPAIFDALRENKGFIISLDNKVNELFFMSNVTANGTFVRPNNSDIGIER
jgi:hypothetical protein